MSASTGAFDNPYDVRALRRRRLRRALRIAVPVGTLLLMLAAVLGIGAFMYQQNRADARALSDDLLNALDRRIATQVQAYLEPAAATVHLIAGVVRDTAFGPDREVIAEPLARRALETHPQFANILFASPSGDFLMLKKQPDGAIDTKLVDRSGGAPRVTWVRRDADGAEIGTEVDPEDRYDPRTRPWYQGAARGDGIYWTNIYIYYTDREPGVTAALPVRDPASGALITVFAVDIQLQALSTFLGNLEVGDNGRAMIIDEAGTLVAYPDAHRMMKIVDGEPAPTRIDDLDDPVLNRAYDSFRLHGHGSREVAIGTRNFITAASPLAVGPTRNWTVLMVVPENDFVGFVARNNRTGLALAGAVLLLASLLAILLAIQGLRADRNARLVLDRQHQLEAQSRAFSELAAQATLFERGDDSSLTVLTRTVSETLSVRRVSVWRIVEDGETLSCVDCYDRDSGGHTQGSALHRRDLEPLFAAVEAGEEIVAARAETDERLAGLHRLYLQPMGCRSLVSVPIVRGTRAVGTLWIEDDGSRLGTDSEEIAFCRAIANILALRRAAPADESARAQAAPAPAGEAGATRAPARDTDPRPVEIAPAMRGTELATGRRGAAFLAYLDRQRSKGREICCEVMPDVCVMVLRLNDDITLAEPAGGEHSVLDHIVREIESLAARHGIEYCKLLGDSIVCAAADEDPARGAGAIAAFALDAQDELRRVFSQLERPIGFTIGVDSGPAIGGMVGNGTAVFNLWGQSVHAAASMADSGTAGCIQLTESTYRRLRDDYLFRVRGTYYLQHFGELTTYILTGRL